VALDRKSVANLPEAAVKRQTPGESESSAAGAYRCLCGRLLARLVPQGVELKCRRCKRHVIVPLEPSGKEAERYPDGRSPSRGEERKL
jgi:phage FluMu protein Com